MGALALQYEIVTRNAALHQQLKDWLEDQELGVSVRLRSPEDTFGKSLCLLCIDIETLGNDVNKYLRSVRRLSDIPIILILPGSQTDEIKLSKNYRNLRQVKQPLDMQSVVEATSDLLISYVNRMERKSKWNSYLAVNG